MQYNKNYSKICVECGCKFFKRKNISLNNWFGWYKRPKGQQFCSKKCHDLSTVGSIPHNKGKKGNSWTDERKQFYRNRTKDKYLSLEFNINNWTYLKKIVAEKDGYTCQMCGLQEREIMVVDHIIPKALSPKLEFIASNCMTLCPNCHARKTIKDRIAVNIARDVEKNQDKEYFYDADKLILSDFELIVLKYIQIFADGTISIYTANIKNNIEKEIKQKIEDSQIIKSAMQRIRRKVNIYISNNLIKNKLCQHQ